MNKKIIRITTVPLALRYLLTGQMKFMKQNGFDVLMISADGKGLKEVIEMEGCPHTIVPMTRTISPVQDFKCLLQMIRIFRKEKPDIVHTHTPKAGLLGMMAAKICGVKTRIHTIAGLRFVTSQGITRKILINMERLTSRAATHVWPNSFSLLETVKEYKLSPVKKLKVIASGSTNGINLQRFSRHVLLPEILNKIKQDIKYDPALKYLLFIGRIVKDKGVEEVLDIFTIVYEKDKSLRLVMVGSLEEALDPINEKAKEILSSHAGIIHIPWNDAVEYFISIATMLLHPSHREGFPNVLLQAGALKCPILCSAIQGNIDVVEHKKTGLLFEAMNRDDLQEKLSFALDNLPFMRENAEALYKKIHSNFDQKIVQQKILEEYRQIMGT